MGSITPASDHQCINVRGGSLDQEIEIGVSRVGELIDDGNRRVDYSLYVVPTDLAVNPSGACGRLGAHQHQACTSWDLGQQDNSLTQKCWPTAWLP